MNDLFLTGASGYLGRRVAALAGGRKIVCLSRRNQPELSRGGIQTVVGDLLEPDSYASYLGPGMTIVHLAAVTGKAKPGEYRRGNIEATRQLLGACQRARVRRLLYVSSVAAKFTALDHYYYGQSKKAAEQLVVASGLDFLVVRPTMIFGLGAPVLAALTRLASLPVLPVFGDGKVRVQPIDVDDLARFLLEMSDWPRFDGRFLEFGGPDVVSLEDLLVRIGRRKRDSKPFTVHIPLGLAIPALAFLEKMLLPVLPITAGQLASFRNDGTAEPNDLWLETKSRLKTLDGMLEVETS